jgi:hypothetical protein
VTNHQRYRRFAAIAAAFDSAGEGALLDWSAETETWTRAELLGALWAGPTDPDWDVDRDLVDHDLFRHGHQPADR